MRVYDVLFTPEHPDEEAAKAKEDGAGEEDGEEDEAEEGKSGAPGWLKMLNPKSLTVCNGDLPTSPHQ